MCHLWLLWKVAQHAASLVSSGPILLSTEGEAIRGPFPTDSPTMTLTDKEQALFTAIQEGMDEPGCGWLHEVTPFQNDHVTAGVLGSLIQKGLILSEEDNEGPMACFWVTLA